MSAERGHQSWKKKVSVTYDSKVCLKNYSMQDKIIAIEDFRQPFRLCSHLLLFFRIAWRPGSNGLIGFRLNATHLTLETAKAKSSTSCKFHMQENPRVYQAFINLQFPLHSATLNNSSRKSTAFFPPLRGNGIVDD